MSCACEATIYELLTHLGIRAALTSPAALPVAAIESFGAGHSAHQTELSEEQRRFPLPGVPWLSTSDDFPELGGNINWSGAKFS